MTQRNDDGFTLAEVLVSLMVLSLVSGVIVATFGGALKQNHKLQSEFSRQSSLSEANRVLTNYGLRVYHPNIGEEELERLDYNSWTGLRIDQSENAWRVVLQEKSDPTGKAIPVFISEAPLRLVFVPGRPNMIRLEEYRYERWIVLTSAPLRVTVPADCEFDIVALKCR